MGMTPDQYWHGDPELTKAYREAYKIRKEEKNWELWLQGLYFFHAFSVALSKVLNKNSKENYMDKPLEIFSHEETEEEKEQKQQEEADKLAATLQAWEKMFNARK